MKPRLADFAAREYTLVTSYDERSGLETTDHLRRWAISQGMTVLSVGVGLVCRACKGHGWVDAAPDVLGCIRGTVTCPTCDGGKTAKAAYDVAMAAWKAENGI